MSKVIILDFGSQVTQLIARRVREAGVYSEIHPCILSAEEVAAMQPDAVILSGGPASVGEKDAPRLDKGILKLGVPVLESVAAILAPICPLLPTPITTSLPLDSAIVRTIW